MEDNAMEVEDGTKWCMALAYASLGAQGRNPVKTVMETFERERRY